MSVETCLGFYSRRMTTVPCLQVRFISATLTGNTIKCKSMWLFWWSTLHKRACKTLLSLGKTVGYSPSTDVCEKECCCSYTGPLSSHQISLTTLFHSYQSVAYFFFFFQRALLSPVISPWGGSQSSLWLEKLRSLLSSAQLGDRSLCTGWNFSTKDVDAPTAATVSPSSNQDMKYQEWRACQKIVQQQLMLQLPRNIRNTWKQNLKGGCWLVHKFHLWGPAKMSSLLSQKLEKNRISLVT